MLGGNQELQEYLLKAPGTSRKALNIACSIGVFLFGWLLAVAFQMLGKGAQGWAYVAVIIAVVVISSRADSPLWVAGIFIYIVGWIHANYVLSSYKASARDRIAQIDRLSDEQKTIDVIMEKGVLQHKVLESGDEAVSTLDAALQMDGGDGELLNLAGCAMLANRRFVEAKQFFSRAISSVKDEAILKQVKVNLGRATKRIK